MTKFLAACASAVFVATPALAGPYDGTYRPDADWAAGWDCQSVGMDGGALAVQGGTFYGVESACRLTNPVPVRDMAATLYDAQCSGEGETYGYRLMLMTTPGGIAVIRDGVVLALKRCN